MTRAAPSTAACVSTPWARRSSSTSLCATTATLPPSRTRRLRRRRSPDTWRASPCGSRVASRGCARAVDQVPPLPVLVALALLVARIVRRNTYWPINGRPAVPPPRVPRPPRQPRCYHRVSPTIQARSTMPVTTWISSMDTNTWSTTTMRTSMHEMAPWHRVARSDHQRLEQ